MKDVPQIQLTMRVNCIKTLHQIPAVASFLIAISFTPTISSAASYDGTSGIIVDIDWLLSHKSDQFVVVIDTRSKNDYFAGHIPGAISIPVDDTFEPGRSEGRVGNIQHIRHLFSDSGLTHDQTLVLYDDSGYIDAGRMFWVLELYGHDNVKLLNGGMPAWSAEPARKISTQQTLLPRTQYTPRINPEKIVSLSQVSMATHDSAKLLLDTRSNMEYQGNKSIARRAGHIPGAINVPWDEAFATVDGVQLLKSTNELRQLYDGAASGKRVYTYCNKGKQSSLTYTLLRQLGHDVAHYDGSWHEWGNDSNLPLGPVKAE